MEIRCLGPLGVVEAGRQRSLGGPKQRLVLAHLLIRANHVVPVDRLIAEVWDGDPPRAARGSVQSYVSHLRRVLGADRITGDGHGYALRVEPSEVDRLGFETLAAKGQQLRATDPAQAAAVLREALELWRGPPFADLADAASLQPEITRLEELRLAVVEDRVGADLDAGAARDVVGELEALLAEHPLREGLWGLLMVALYRSGRQADALAAFERARRLLADELGIDPSAELRSLHAQVLRQDPSLRATGATLKGYRLLERVGEGTFGVVWRATQPGTGREVAVKVARPALANDPAFIRRFEVDAQRMARIEHPHVVPLYDFWREPDGAYLVMRYLRGGTLRAVLDRAEALDEADARRIADQLAQGLAAAHARGVVHGDITPSNVLLDEQSNAYLTDFGVAGAGANPDATPPAADLPYRPPERRAGGDPDARGDVYALGTLLNALVRDAGDAVAAVLARATGEQPDLRQPDGGALLADLRAAADARGPPPAAMPGAGREELDVGPVIRNPYKGLRAFVESDAVDFFGRSAVVAQLLSVLREDGRFLAVVGPSGSGKSSVVRAGLVPALRAGAVDGSNGWFIVQLVPGDRPFDELATALRRVVVDAPADLTHDLEQRGLTAVDPLLPDDGDVLVVIDQFEELFTLTDDARRQRFVEMLVAAVTATDSRARVVVTLRADFYDRPLEHAGLGALVRAHSETLLPLTAGEVEQAVTGPAEQAGVTVERRLVAQMVAEVTDQPGALPLLQYALTELFDGRQDATLTAEAYQAIGGLTGALARRADATYGGLADGQREVARQLFLRLVTPGEGVEDTRRRAIVEHVTALAPEVMPDVLQAFGDARLLSFDRDPETRAPTVEVAHEALLREWPRLRGWIDAGRDDLRTHRRLAAATADWTAADRDPSYLATGSQLVQYETWRASAGLIPTTLEQAYLNASVEHRDRIQAEEAARRQRELDLERRSVRRLRTLVAVLGAAALIAGGLTIFAIGQARRAADQTLRAEGEAQRAEREARVATARELAAAADANLDVDPERSMLLAVEAVNATRATDNTVLRQAEEALHRAVGASRIVRLMPDVGGALDWSPRGDIFVTEGPEDSGIIDVLDATTGASLRTWHGHDVDINFVTFSDDGALLATTGDDGAIRVWDPQTGDLVADFTADTDVPVWRPKFDAAGARVAAAFYSGQVRVLDVASGRLVTTLAPDVLPVAVALSPDGDRIAVSFVGVPDVTVYDVRTGDVLLTLEGAEFSYSSLAWSPDGRRIAAGSEDGTTPIWNSRTGALTATLFGHSAGQYHVAWSSDSTRLVTGSFDGTANVWSVTDAGVRQLHTLAASHMTGGVLGVAFSPDDRYVMVGDAEANATSIWNISPLRGAEWTNLPGHRARFVGGDRVASSSGDDVMVISDATDGSEVLGIAGHRSHDAFIDALDVSPDGRLIGGAVHFDRPKPGTEKPEDFPVAGSGVETLSPARQHIATVWNTETGAERISVPHDAWISDVVVHEDVVVSADTDGVTKITDLSGEQIAVLREEPNNAVVALALSPDAQLLATVTVSRRLIVRLRVWDVASREIVHTMEHLAETVAFTADGSRLVIAGADGARVWDVRTWERTAAFDGHAGRVSVAAVAPDGATVATAGTDRTVRLWAPANGNERLTLQGHEQEVTDIAFSDDGTKLVTAGLDGVARVWALDLDDLIAIAEDKLTRGFTEAECREYLHMNACP
jgi:WD40 repeat protein/DNA-binding SARP family transcriptional activator